MAQMTAALASMHFCARHAKASVGGRFNGTGFGIGETRPTGAAFKFGLSNKQRLIAAGARERAFAFFHQQRARAGAFGAMAAICAGVSG